MPHDIESNFTKDYWNEEKQCHFCDSFEVQGEKCICHESDEEIAPTSHCDFFRSRD